MIEVLDESERVLVIPRSELFKEESGRPTFQGFSKGTESLFLEIFENKHLLYRPRALVENEPEYKQLIPYICLRNSSGQVFGYQRTKKGGESRLHGKWTIGFGGHMNDGDKDLDAALYRELLEEVDLIDCSPAGPTIDKIGFVNDDSSEVGRVHFGIVLLATIDGQPKPTKDVGLANLCWRSSEDWLALELEPWSKLVLENL